MPMNEVFAAIKTVSSGITVVSTGITSVAKSFEEMKSVCNIGWFQSTKTKIDELKVKLNDAQTKIVGLGETVHNLENTIDALKQKINTELPELKQLVTSYSEVRKDVAVAGAIANKASEIIRIRPDIASIYTFTLTAPTRSEHTRIVANIETLPPIDTEVFGVIREKLSRIGVLIRDLERMNTPQTQTQDVDVSATKVAELFQEIFEGYAGIETRLSELLNRKILKDFDPVF